MIECLPGAAQGGVWFNCPLAVIPDAVEEITLRHAARQRGETPRVAGRSVAAQLEPGRSAPTGRGAGRLAVLPVFGLISQHPDWLSDTSTELLGVELDRAVADPEVSAVLMCFDSHGGSVFGVAELAAKIFAARQRKPIIGVASSMAASAAYWLMSQCTEAFATVGGMVGSIGCLAAHMDMSGMLDMAGVKVTLVTAGKYKAEGDPSRPLTDDAEAAMQRTIDSYYERFVADVARGRGVRPEAVARGYGQGRVLVAGDALAAGMIDAIASFEEVYRLWKVQAEGPAPRGGRLGASAIAGRATAATTAMTPEDDEDHDDFLERCTGQGNSEDQCEIWWDQNASARASAKRTTARSPRSTRSPRSRGTIIRGWATVWDTPIERLDGEGPYTMIFRRGCFSKGLKSGRSFHCVLDHEKYHVLGTTPDGLSVWEDNLGLAFELRARPVGRGVMAIRAAKDRSFAGVSLEHLKSDASVRWSRDGAGRRVVEVFETVLLGVSLCLQDDPGCKATAGAVFLATDFAAAQSARRRLQLAAAEREVHPV
jgi:signal peptide peptidase SppA